MKEQKISVIIPIYNIRKYVDKCIKSVQRQTYKKLEIILVDDGSTDGSEKICDKYKIDKRVRVIHKKNGGLSDARNVGIDIATGQYLFFIDGDDYISKSCIRDLYNELIKNKSDISTTGFVPFYDNDQPIEKAGKSRTFQTQKALQRLLYQKHVTNSAWGKLYKKELFNNNLRYPKGKICEDLPTTYRLFAKAKKVTISNSRKYFYLQRRNSIINAPFKPERLEAISFAKQETSYIEKNYPKITKAAKNREFMEYVYTYNTIVNSEGYEKEKRLLLIDANKLRKTVLLDPKSKLITKAYAIIGLEKMHKIRRKIKNV